MKEVYLARKGGEVIHHTDRKAMLEIDNLKPEKTVSLEEFESAGGLVRIIGDEIILGKTKAELAAEKASARRSEIDAELQSIDAKSGRSARAVAAAMAKGEKPNPADVERLEDYEQRSVNLRSELNSLKSGVAG
jgi:hypothetical protein